MALKMFKTYPWVYCYRGTNGITLYDWLNKRLLNLDIQDAKIFDELLKGVPEEYIHTQSEFLDKLKNYGFISGEDLYLDTFVLGSRLQKAMKFINMFQIQRLDLLFTTSCELYELCPLRKADTVSHICESCIGCTKNPSQENHKQDIQYITTMIRIFRPLIVSLSGGELFTDITIMDDILSKLTDLEYPKIVVLIMPAHAIIKFKEVIIEYNHRLTQNNKTLTLTAVLLDSSPHWATKVSYICNAINIPSNIVIYTDLKHPSLTPSNFSAGKVNITWTFYSNSKQIDTSDLARFLRRVPKSSYLFTQISIEDLTISLEHNYAPCLYGNLCISIPNGYIAPCKGYSPHYTESRLGRKELQKIILSWSDPCRECSLKGACRMCRTVIHCMKVTPQTCPIWNNVLEGER